MSTTRTLSSLLRDADGPSGQLFARTRLHRELQSCLESILGPDLASHYRIQNLRHGILVLQADAPSWAARLRFEQPRLLQRLKDVPALQQLRDLQIRVAPPEQPRPRAVRRAQLSREAAAVLDSAASATADPQLRAALQRLANRGKR